ncbi:MAG: hypothetical protein ACD_43C00008G0003 [uncultured bacterium]|nr:MAG: hypothetical protein ACD_43C00008G0003 [uncultured bacterium]
MTAYNQISANKFRSGLLVALFFGFVLGLCVVVSYVYDGGIGGVIFATIIATVMALVGYYSGPRLALLTSGAHGPISVADNAYVYRLVENLAITAGLPMPKVYIINDPTPNAFATGRNPQTASIAFTTGIIELLENEELEGVAAHELSHIKNYDTRLMTVVIICVGLVSLLAQLFLRFGGFGGSRRSKNNTGLVIAIIGLILLIFSPLISKLIQLAVSRKREFLADASGMLLTRYPEGLARALEKIDQHAAPLIRANQATAHLYIANPFGHSGRKFRNWFSTHPPIPDRVQALRSMA